MCRCTPVPPFCLRYLIACVFVSESPAGSGGAGGGPGSCSANSHQLQRGKQDQELAMVLIGFDLAVIVGGISSAIIMLVLLPEDMKPQQFHSFRFLGSMQGPREDLFGDDGRHGNPVRQRTSWLPAV